MDCLGTFGPCNGLFVGRTPVANTAPLINQPPARALDAGSSGGKMCNKSLGCNIWKYVEVYNGFPGWPINVRSFMSVPGVGGMLTFKVGPGNEI